MTNHSLDSYLHEIELSREFLDLAHRALRQTNATGIAIALKQSGAFVCMATAGSTAPSLGVQLDDQSGITGACIRSGKPVICDDASADPRVNAAACRELQIASVVVVPIVEDGETIGVFEALSDRPRAFTATEQITLENLAMEVTTSPARRTFAGRKISTESSKAAETPAGLKALRNQELQSVWDAAQAEDHSMNVENFFDDDHGSSLKHETSNTRVLGPLVLCAAVFIGIVVLFLIFLFQPASRSSQTTMNLVGNTAEAASIPDPAAVPSSSRNENAKESQRQTERDLEAAARAGDSAAQIKLATDFAQGRGVRRDLVAAYTWYIVANSAGAEDSEGGLSTLSRQLTPAQLAQVRMKLAEMFWKGVGVKQDRTSAYTWVELAHAAGSTKAARVRKAWAKEMSEPQIAQAQQRADAWLEQHHQPTLKR